jgi:penicillin-binding protein 2
VRIYEDLRIVQVRIGVIHTGIVCVLGLLAVYFWHLQVLEAQTYRALADNNRTRTVTLAAPRGALLDRNGHILVENRPSFNIIVTPEHSEDLDLTVARMGRVLNMGEAQIRERLARRATPFQPVVVKADASFEDVAALEARRLELPEADVDVVPIRSYPLAAAAAHTLGRVGEISLPQLQSVDFPGLEPGALVGQAGIEAAYNRNLMGRDGFRRVIVNSRGIEVAEKDRQPPTDGPKLTLTLDAGLQRAVEAAFKGRAGSAVALDPENGEILAMTSTPGYDPNQFSTGIDQILWSRLATDPTTPLMNRVIQGAYSPGSLFKVVTATAALEEGVITPETAFFCPGYLAIYGTSFRCAKAGGHGWVNVHSALALSCNVFFYQVAVRLEIERIARYARRMGLGTPTGVDLPHEASGLVPNAEWKFRTQKLPWYPGETVSVGIGQGQVSVTPLQIARIAALLANGGKLVRPHIVRAIGGVPVEPEAPEDLGFRRATLATIRAALKAVVNEQGTGWRAQLPGIVVSGKTGSAQVVTHAHLAKGPSPALLPHGWFLCFAPEDHPRIALVTMVEHGGSGGESAAPVAHEILGYFFRNQRAPEIAGVPDTEN